MEIGRSEYKLHPAIYTEDSEVGSLNFSLINYDGSWSSNDLDEVVVDEAIEADDEYDVQSDDESDVIRNRSNLNHYYIYYTIS
jgi:hypothetical protein